MTGPLRRLALIGNSLPRRCGIATFTTDLQQAIARLPADVDTVIVAMTDAGSQYAYPGTVGFQINDNERADYEDAAAFLNDGSFDAVSLQHEFGIFGGDAGEFIVPLLTKLKPPLVTTLHTVLATPTPSQQRVLQGIVEVSAKLVVMADKGRQLLVDVYKTPPEKIETIPHGVPDFPFVTPDQAKARLGYSGKAVILTFGLLSPNKGIEVMIEAMPSILTHSPNVIYVVLGATHPSLIRRDGEAYRESLVARVHALGIEDHVVFLDQFVDQATLLGFIAMCDVYVTPYLNEAQMTSGTLAYSFGLGKAVVSTPYWHARELLADGKGLLVPFREPAALSAAISSLLTDDIRRDAMRKRAYAASRSMTWEQTATRYLATMTEVRRAALPRTLASARLTGRCEARRPLPDMSVEHLRSMCDDTGLFQHAIHSIPDRAHGYCVDDNARALLLACTLDAAREQPLPEAMTSTFAAFVQHAWNPDTRRFRNFMSFDRHWLEPSGSEDSHGRTLWALGVCASDDAGPARRLWAAHLFAQALPVVENFTSPRAWAFTLLGLDRHCATFIGDPHAQRLRAVLSDKLLALMTEIETSDWVWFEAGLTYDNARLPQALIVTGDATASERHLSAGLRSLRWLMELQTSAKGTFRPIGTEGFGDQRTKPKAFDQQPVEAAAAISACLAAYRVGGEREWKQYAERAFAWFLGSNDLNTPLVDVTSGACRDGLHADRPNENRGGESVVSYLLGLAELRALARVHRYDNGEIHLNVTRIGPRTHTIEVPRAAL
jgi:glycosyltransferase involved in cell wall biosynthesis